MRRTAALIGCVSLASFGAGCHKIVGIAPPPPRSGMASVLLLVGSQSETIRVWGTDLGEGEAYPAFDGPARPDLRALFYRCSLFAIGLSPGWQTRTAGQEGIQIPESTESLHLAPGSDTWTEDPGFQAPAELRLASKLACATFTPKVYPLGVAAGAEAGTIALALDIHTALAATADGVFYRIRDDLDHAERLSLPRALPHGDGYRAPDGRIFLFDDKGNVAEGNPDIGFSPVPAATATHGRDLEDVAIAGPTVIDAPFELFTVSSTGAFRRFDGAHWKNLVPGGHHEKDSSRIVWAGPEEAFALGVAGAMNQVVHYDHGALTFETVSDLIPRAQGFGYAPGVGVLVGLDDGVVFVRRPDGTWRSLPHAFMANVHAFAAFGGGFLSGTEHGVVTQYDPLLGWCPPAGLATADPARFVPFADGYLITETGDNDHPTDENSATYIVPNQQVEACVP